MFPTFTILLFLMLVAVVVTLSIKRIPEGQVYTLRRLGRPAGTLSAGTHLVVPLVERIAHKISITGYTLAIDERGELTEASGQALRGRVWWQVLDPERAEAVIDRANELIRKRLREAISGIDAGADADLRSRNQRIKHSLNGTLRERGVLVTRVELDLAA